MRDRQREYERIARMQMIGMCRVLPLLVIAFIALVAFW
jgi:hypothetical protein